MKKSEFVSKLSGVKNILFVLLCVTLIFQQILPVYGAGVPNEPDIAAMGQSAATLGMSTRSTPRGFSSDPNEYEIYPVPHEVNYGDPTHFSIGNSVNLVLESGVDTATKNFLVEVLEKYSVNYTESSTPVSGKTNFFLGVSGSGELVDTKVQADSLQQQSDLFSKTDAYLLSASPQSIVILGKDEDSVFYGVATLQMMFSSFSGAYFLPVHIEDWAEMQVRGFIEGFYGGWNYDGRASLMRSARDVKMNSYIYASKSDSYHTDNWALLYPAEDLAQMEELVRIGEETKVKFAWSVHLKTFFRNLNATQNPEEFDVRYNKLIAKFDQLRGIGITRFDILNDDFGSGSTEDVVTLLNRLMTDYMDPNGLEPIIYCPQGYNVNWSGNGAELEVLKNLDPRITIYWTGQDVNSPIEQSSINHLLTKTGLSPVFWINYPVNEHAGSGLFLGNINHYARDGVVGLGGAVSNPSKFTESNKVGIFQLASLFWNNQNFSQYSDKLWEDTFKYLQPEVEDSYLTIARNISNAPNSGRVGNSFPESDYIEEWLTLVMNQALTGNNISELPQTELLLLEFDNILAAIETFKSDCNNTVLVTEITPWINSLKDVTTASREIVTALIALEESDIDLAWSSLSASSKSLATWDSYRRSPNEAGDNTVAKAGSKRLQPFAAKLILYVSNQLTPILNPESPDFIPSFYGVMGGTVQSDTANTAKVFDGDPLTFATFQSNQKKDDYYGVDFGRVITVNDVEILQGKDDSHHDYFHKSTLEYSSNGKDWTTLVPLVNSRKITSSGLAIRARYVRLRLVETGDGSTSHFWTYIREIAVNKSTVPYDLYTNVAALPNLSVEFDGNFYRLLNKSNTAVNLPSGGYIGLKLPSIIGVNNITTAPILPAGTTLQHSLNGINWEDASAMTPPVLARYARIYNGSTEAVSLPFNQLEVAVSQVSLSPKVIETNLVQSLNEGSWENLFDGQRDTYALTNEPQSVGQFVLVDLGGHLPINDVTVLTTDGVNHVYKGVLSMSNDKTSWTTIATINNDSTINPPYRFIEGNGQGEIARYLKLEITEAQTYSLKIHEFEINKTGEIQPELGAFSGVPTGDFQLMMDGNVSTLFSPGVISETNGFFQYLISDNLNLESISILQDPNSLCNATVTVELLDGSWKTLGRLEQSANYFLTKDLGGITKLRIEWVTGSSPSIAEIFLSTGKSEEGDGEGNIILYPNVYSVPAVENVTVNFGTPWELIGLPNTVEVKLSNQLTAIIAVKWSSTKYNEAVSGDYVALGQLVLPEHILNPANLYLESVVTVKKDGTVSEVTGNLALNQPVEVSGTETSGMTGSLAVDGILSTRWSANKMKEKDDTNPVNQVAGNNWISVDLGVGYNTIAAVSISYHAKTHGTIYEILMSDDNQTWTTAAQVNEAASNVQNAVHTIPLSPSTTGRYLKVVYTEMNINALAATGVSITELVVNGTKSSAPPAAEENLALLRPVEVSGMETASFPGDLAVDGNNSTRWCSNLMKDSQNQSESTPQRPAWIVVDLGGDVSEIRSVSAKYFNLVYSTKYEVQVSSDNIEWETVHQFSKPHGGAGGPTDSIIFTNPIKNKRYIRLSFEQMNVAAVGHAVGIVELVVNGTRAVTQDPVVESVTLQNAVDVLGAPFSELTLPTRAVAQLADGSLVSLPVIWESSSYDSSLSTQTLSGELVLSNGILNPQNIVAAVQLVLEAVPQVSTATAQSIIVRYETEFDSLPLPTTVPVHLDNGHVVKLGVTWKAGTFDPSLEGDQIIYGDIVLSNKVKNDDTIEATIMVTVLSKEVDLSALTALIEEIEGKISRGELKPEDYTASSWTILYNELTAARQLLAQSPSQDIVEAKIDSLLSAYNSLDQHEPVDLSVLTALIEEIEGKISRGELKPEDYTASSWTILYNELTTARQLLAQSPSQDIVEAKIDSLLSAYNSLDQHEPVDLSVLTALIEEIEEKISRGELKPEDYTASSWTILYSELTTARQLLAQSPSQDIVDAKIDSLLSAYNSLAVDYPNEKSQLNQLINSINSQISQGILTQADYTDTSWKSLQDVISEAELLLSSSATGSEILAMTKKLNSALAALTPVVNALDLAPLTNLITQANALKSTEYTEASWNKLVSILAQAQAELNNSNATQEDIDNSYSDLQSAIKALVKALDLAPLTNLITQANALESTEYTEASWNKLVSILAQAQAELNNSNATQGDIDNSYSDLQSAIKALVKISGDGGNTGGNTGVNTGGSTGSSNSGGKESPDKSSNLPTASKESTPTPPASPSIPQVSEGTKPPVVTTPAPITEEGTMATAADADQQAQPKETPAAKEADKVLENLANNDSDEAENLPPIVEGKDLAENESDSANAKKSPATAIIIGVAIASVAALGIVFLRLRKKL